MRNSLSVFVNNKFLLKKRLNIEYYWIDYELL